jgi:hypothetical protein
MEWNSNLLCITKRPRIPLVVVWLRSLHQYVSKEQAEFWKIEREALEKWGKQLGVKEPEPLNPLPFSRVPRGYWTDVNAQRLALEKFGREKFGVKELDDWYHVSARNIHHKLSFLKKYGSLFAALKTFYPHHNWDPLRFSVVPKGYWSDEKAQKDALERLGRQLGVKELDDWYAVSSEVYSQLSFVGNYYRGSLFDVLKKFYPQHNWDPLRFSRVPNGYWTEDAQRAALEKYGREQLGVKELDDWHSVPTVIMRRELSFIKNYYGGSLLEALKKLYPHHKWDAKKFATVSRPDADTHKEALEKYGREILGVKELDDWYSVSAKKVRRELSFVTKYGSLHNALKKFYPQHNWEVLRFCRVTKGYWQQPHVVQQYRDMFIRWKNEHNISHVRDWFLLPPRQLMMFKRASIGIFGSKMKMLEMWFPEILWRSQCTQEMELQVLPLVSQ